MTVNCFSPYAVCFVLLVLWFCFSVICEALWAAVTCMKSQIQIKLEWLTDWFLFLPQSTCEHMSRPLVVISNNAGLWHLTTASHMPIFYIQSRQHSVGLCWEKTSKGFVELTERPWLCWTAAVVHAGLCVFSLPCFYSAQLLAYLLVALLYKLDFTEKLLFKCSESMIVKVCAGWRPNAERINKMDRR